jgi:hypothetical protein
MSRFRYSAAAMGRVYLVGAVFGHRAKDARGEPPMRIHGRFFMDMASRRASRIMPCREMEKYG